MAATTRQGAGVLVDSLRDVFPDKRPVFLVGILADKDYRSMLRAVAPLASAFVCVTPPNPRALDAADLAEAIRETCGELGARATIEVAGDFYDAASAARKIAGSEGLICAFGSLYSIARCQGGVSSRCGQQLFAAVGFPDNISHIRRLATARDGARLLLFACRGISCKRHYRK